MAEKLIDAKKIKAEMDDMIKMVSHPEFVSAMKKMKELSMTKKMDFAKKNLNVETLKEKGVPMPENMRITTRYFEPNKPDIIEIDPEGNILKTKKPKFPIGSSGVVAWGGCACGGAASVCGGAGMSN